MPGYDWSKDDSGTIIGANVSAGYTPSYSGADTSNTQSWDEQQGNQNNQTDYSNQFNKSTQGVYD